LQCDLTSEDDVAAFFTSASEDSNFGPVQIPVINHAVFTQQPTPVKDMTLQQWTHTINSNLTSSFLVAKEYLRQLEKCSDELKAKASIVFVSSDSGKIGAAGHADYAATKSGMHQRTF
jgi:NAD(P)-dependent dehydrogenase (short-subunit alcohol dehydrogenase family)